MTDTIAAVSTAYGKGGIAVIRISGDDAIAIASRVFTPASSKPLSTVEGGRVVYGAIHAPSVQGEQGRVLDDGMAAVLRAPRSYTGEDTVEISCHGGILLTEQVLSAVLAAGARPAEAGEFTKRAFVAGKLSLTEAEAVINLIDAESEEALKLARSHTGGVLTRALEEFYQRLLSLVSTAYVYADYPEEDLTDLTPAEMIASLTALIQEMQALGATWRAGHAICDGISTVLAGRPNTGKSSILNRLLGRDRAIVSNIAGTTRDTIEEKVQVGRVTLRLTDTAGLRESADPIEQIGVERSFAALSAAELILVVIDSAAALTQEDRELLEKLAGYPAPKLALLNKSDLGAAPMATELADYPFHAICPVSAVTGEGMDRLRSTIEALFVEGEIDYNTTAVLANARQKNALDRSIEAAMRALGALESGFTPDIAGMDIEEAMAALAEVDGRAVSTDIVDAIFHRFCVGK